IYTPCSCINNYALVKDILCHIISLCQLEHNDLLTSIIEQKSNNVMDVLSTEISTQINNRILRTMDKSSSSSSFPFEQIQQLLRHLGVHTILKELLNIRFKLCSMFDDTLFLMNSFSRVRNILESLLSTITYSKSLSSSSSSSLSTITYSTSLSSSSSSWSIIQFPDNTSKQDLLFNLKFFHLLNILLTEENDILLKKYCKWTSESSHSPEQHRRRRHHRHSPERCLVDIRRRRSHPPTRHRRQRSKSRSKLLRKPKSPITDWRKDLMAGRRHSPPEMPESSYYGNEKRSKGHRHSKKHDRQRYGNSQSHKSQKRCPSHNADYYRPRKHTHDSGSRHHNIVKVNERDQRSGYLEQSRKDGFAENYRKYEGPDLPSHYDHRSSSRYRHDAESHGRNASPGSSRALDRESD
ncbi:serine/arginine repetitive matrix protein 1, partial [Schistosoma bovis]